MKTATSDEKTSFFLNRNFALLWLGQGISIFGDYLFNVTLILWIGSRIGVGQSWAPLAVSGVLVATAVPSLLVGPFAGVFVDRWNKRRTMLVMDLCCTLLTLLLALLSLGSASQPPIVLLIEMYGIVFLLTTCTQFFSPAAMALLGNILEKKDFTRAVGRLQATSGVATILGLALSAPLFFGVGVQWALLIDALSFLFSFSTICFMRVPETASSDQAVQEKHFLQEFVEGLRCYIRIRELMTLLITLGIFLMGAGVINTLNFFFITENLHASAAVFSYANAIFGLGTILGAILAMQGAKWLGARKLFWLSLLLTGVLLLLYASMTSLVLAILIFFLLAFPNSISNTVSTPILLEVTPGPFVGRVVAALGTVLTLMKILATVLAGYLASGVLSDLHTDIAGIPLNALSLLFLIAGLLTIGAGIYARFSLRKRTPTDEAETTSETEARTAL